MPTYNLIKNNQIVNTIVSDMDFPENLKSAGDIDSYEEVLPPEPVPVPVPEVPVLPTVWTSDDFRSNMTLTEKVKWDNNADPIVNTVKIELSVPKERAAVIELTDLLVSSNVISEATATKILSAH